MYAVFMDGHEALQDTAGTVASPPKRSTDSRANWRMCVQDSMPQLRLYVIILERLAEIMGRDKRNTEKK